MSTTEKIKILIDELRKDAKDHETKIHTCTDSLYYEGLADAKHVCANKLEKIINNTK